MTENENTQLETTKNISKTKKIILWIAVVLIILIAGAYGYWHFFMRITTNIISYIPQNFDQIYYMKIDDDFKELLDKVKTEGTNNKMFEVIKTVDEIAAYDYLSGDQTISFMLAKVGKNFNMQDAIQAGLETGNSYEFKELKKGVYVYGDKKSVDFAINYKGTRFMNDSQLGSKAKELASGKYNFAMFTKANTSRFSEDTTLSDFLKKLGYGSFLAHVGYKRSYGQLGIIFNQDLGYGKDYSFNSKFGNYINKDSIIFTELGNIPKFLGVNSSQLSAGIEMLLSQIPNSSMIMTQDDYQKVANTFDGNSALSLTKSDNIAGVGLGILFEKSDMFDVVSKLFPYLKTALDEEIKQTASTGVDIKYTQEDNKIGADITASMGGIPLKIGVNLKKNSDNLALEILSPNLNTSNDVKLKSNGKTLLTFYVELNNLIELYNKVSMLSANSQSLPNLDIFKDKKVYGSLEIDGTSLLLDYDTQN